MRNLARKICLGALVTTYGLAGAPAFGQGIEEVIVTARKRQETAIATPVVMSVFSEKDIQRYGTSSFDKLDGVTPGLILNTDSNTGAGASIFLRGVGSGDGNPTSDQSVAVNIDGFTVASGTALRVGFMDMKQVEVLKGPQTLYFGKNSPGGVLSLTTADPTDEFEVTGLVGYEFKAREVKTEGVVSGPVSKKVLLRLAVGYTHSEGWTTNSFPNVTPADALSPSGFTPLSVQPLQDRAPLGRDYFLRATVKLMPTDRLMIRGKFTYGDHRDNLGNHNIQRVTCPNGGIASGDFTSAAVGALVDCKADDKRQNSWVPPDVRLSEIAKFGSDWVPLDGSGFSHSQIFMGTIEATYDLTPSLTFTSLSGALWADDHFIDEYSMTPVSFIDGAEDSYRRDFTQEVRLQSHYDLPINFMFGGFYQNLFVTDSVPASFDVFDTLFGTGAGLFSYRGSAHYRRAYALFGQTTINLTKDLELSAGARWTDEQVHSRLYDDAQPIDQRFVYEKTAFYNLSPEVTVSYRPTKNLNFFGSYRTGYKSGGFDAGNNAPLAKFNPERAMGGEIGVKARMLDGSLEFNTSLYRYTYTDLQVSVFDPQKTLVHLVNGGDARVQGFDFDASWQPAFAEGLQFRGAFNYNHARYTRFIADCYTGQSVSEGCNLELDPSTGRFIKQDLTGRQLIYAPDWTANAGVVYEFGLPNTGLRLAVSSDVQYSGSFQTNLSKFPGLEQDSYAKVNASLRLSDENDSWELSFIGRNLTNEYTIQNGSASVDAGLGVIGSDNMTGTVTGARWDGFAVVSRGREFWLQLKIRPLDMMKH